MIIMDDELKASRLMIIEDDPVYLGRLLDLLEQSGFQFITSTGDHKESLSLFHEKTYDLILFNLNLSGSNDFELLKHLKQLETLPLPPILILTDTDDKQLRINALHQGAQDILEKASDSDELINRICNTLQMHLSKKRLSDYSQTLEKAVRETTFKLEKAQAEIVKRLAYAAKYKDSETANHTVRVGWYSRILAKRLGYRQEECDLIFDAAPMHDIGKIGIPDYILLKPGKLSADEWTIMKTHTTIGGQIFADGSTRLMKFARIIALSHHEKWDGTGYPNGLAGEKIPIFGRIVMIADVFDALTTVRPYKPAWELDKALEYISEEAGTTFDPKLINIFKEALPEIKDIYKNNPD